MATNVLRITVRFLDPEPSFHGKRDGGEPDWPPSPLRLFQALVDAAASRWRGSQFDDCAKPALVALQGLTPEIVAPEHRVGTPFRTAVPNNDLDVWAGPISKGNEPKKQPNELKTMKTIQPIRVRIGEGKDKDALYYLYPMPELLADKRTELVNVIGAAARSVTHLGWGIDMVAADADVISEEDAAKLPGHRWRVVPAGGVPLRVPKVGTLDDLIRKHENFLGRLPEGGGFKPVPPLSCFDTVQYYSDTAPGCVAPARPFAAFSLLTPDAEQTAAFDKLTGTRDVAGLIRHLLDSEYERFDFDADTRGTYVNGHNADGTPVRGAAADRRLMFLPLPTINHALGRVEAIRRLLVVGPAGDTARIEDLGRRLCGEVLEHIGTPRALLTVLPKSDWVLRQYTDESDVWSTVTPAVFPGHHKGDLDEGDRLARLMFAHAGLPDPAELWWRPVGFRAGVEMANRYTRPDNMDGSIYHLRVRFPRKVRGPLAVGAGRYRGFGLLAVDS